MTSMDPPFRQPRSVKELLALWPTLEHVAADTGDEISTVKKWDANGRIPIHRQHDVICAARARGLPLTADAVVQMHAGQPGGKWRKTRESAEAAEENPQPSPEKGGADAVHASSTASPAKA